MSHRSKKKQQGLLIGYELAKDGWRTGKPVYISLTTVDRHGIKIGKSGSGKSVSTCDELFELAKFRSVGLFDPNSHLANDALDRIVSRPRLARRCLYVTITSRKFVPLIDFTQQSCEATKTDVARRKYIASLFTNAVIATAAPSGSTAGAGFTRLKLNVEMGVRLLLELQLPLAFLPHLFRFKSPILEVLVEKIEDVDVRFHFNNLRAQGNANQLFNLTESTISRLNLLFNSAVMEGMFSVAGGGLTAENILRRKNMILIGDFGVNNELTPEHSRMAMKVIYESLYRVAMNRSDEEAKEFPLSLYIDEASASGLLDLGMAQSFQQLRKFGLHICSIIQGVATLEALQPEIRLFDSILENVSSKFVYGLASDVDAQRLARLAIPGMDFKEVKHRKEIERQRLVGYEQMIRATVSTNHEGQKSTSVTPVERPLLETEMDEQLVFYSPEESFHKKAGGLLGTDTGEFTYYGPRYPAGIDLYTPAPKQFTAVTRRLQKRKREEFIQKQLRSFPYRDIDGISRDFQQLLEKYGLPVAPKKSSEQPTGPNPFE
jgi:hypothetical protein